MMMKGDDRKIFCDKCGEHFYSLHDNVKILNRPTLAVCDECDDKGGVIEGIDVDCNGVYPYGEWC